MKQQQTARLETISKMYDIPLWSLRKMASRREFPGIIQRKGTRRIYVDIDKFDAWFRADGDSTTEVSE